MDAFRARAWARFFISLSSALWLFPLAAQVVPNDPGYKAQWNLHSSLPADHHGPVDGWERLKGPGVGADLSWQLHTGHPDTVIAIFDAGIDWSNADLVDRVRLNTSELPLPSGARTHDANGDGRVSPRDYAQDSRVGDRNANGHIDAEDLILAFSNGVDEDHNGYVDDIAGWDFYENDNNPSDRVNFQHGTMEAEFSVAAINNATAGAGICGNCSFLPIRVNDSFMVDSNLMVPAIAYALERKVAVIQQALGGLNSNPAIAAALDDAYRQGVTIIGTAADEHSTHLNFPSALDPVIYPNSIRFDSRDIKDATTFLNLNNCSNYGDRIDVTVPGIRCSSEATGILSGVVALVHSYAKAEGRVLLPGEITALVKTTALDINRGAAARNSEHHDTYPGWDQVSGYGRLDAWAMMQAVRQGKIPPEARIILPRWHEVYRFGAELRIPVTIRVGGRGKHSVRLEVAAGIETHAVPWHVVVEREIDGTWEGVLATLLPEWLSTKVNPHGPHGAYTLRLNVTSGDGLSAESRRTIFVSEDPQLVPGFPKSLEGSGESSGLFIDLYGKGREAFVTADGSGTVHAFDYSGQELPGFPVKSRVSRYERASHRPGIPTLHESFLAPVAAGDIDGDGEPELVAASLEGTVYAWDRTGTCKDGFPIALPMTDWAMVTKEEILGHGVTAAPTLVDLNGDGALDIVIMGLDGHVYAFAKEGMALPGFPAPVTVGGRRAKLAASPAVLARLGHKQPSLIFGSNHVGDSSGYLFQLPANGTLGLPSDVPGFPIRIPLIKDNLIPIIGEGITAAPAIADFDGDGLPEILAHGFVGKSYLVDLRGGIRSLDLRAAPGHNTNDTMMVPAFGAPAVGDVSGDGILDPVLTGVGRRMLVNRALGGKKFDYDSMIGVYDGKSRLMTTGYPRKMDDLMIMGAAVIADLDGDGGEDVIAGSGGGYVRGFTRRGEAEGFPHATFGWVIATPALGDMDGDGRLELAATTREGYVYIWQTDAKRPRGQGWLTAKGNPQRTGHRP